MQFFTEDDCRSWAERRGFPLGERPFSVLADQPPFSVRMFRIPADAGKRVALARSLWDDVGRGRPETLVWMTDWSVWPSGEHMPLVVSLRRGFGEARDLGKAPGMLARLGEDDDALSMLVVAILFLWDCWLLAVDGSIAVSLSHDEYGMVCARGSVPEGLLRRLEALGVLNDASAA